MNKKGELTTTQIVTIVILILSFIIILLFFFNYNWGGQTDREVCRSSVQTRAIQPDEAQLTSLNCKTQQVCFSMGGECKGVVKDATIIKVNDRNDINKELTNLMYDCWWQMGEGELDYAPKELKGRNYCAICSVIYFDDKIQQDEPIILANELYEYMGKETIPGKQQTYLNYLYGTDSFAEINTKSIEETETDLSQDYYSTSKPYAIVTSLDKGGSWLGSLVGGTIGTIVGSIITVATGGSGSILVISGAGIGSGMGHIVTNGDLTFIKPIILPYDSQEIVDAFECKEFSSLY